MSLLERIALDRLTPVRLWEALDGETRLTASRALYRRDWGEASTRREADLTIAVKAAPDPSAFGVAVVDDQAGADQSVHILRRALPESRDYPLVAVSGLVDGFSARSVQG